MSIKITSNDLDGFENPNIDIDYMITIKIPEFTCLCPKTGQPDFAKIYIKYVPDLSCIELKSLKIYITKYRNVGGFHEAVTDQIFNHLKDAFSPKYLNVRSKFNVRGGIYTEVEFQYKKEKWKPRIDL